MDNIAVQLEQAKKTLIDDIINHPLDSNLERMDRWVQNESITKEQLALLVMSLNTFFNSSVEWGK